MPPPSAVARARKEAGVRTARMIGRFALAALVACTPTPTPDTRVPAKEARTVPTTPAVAQPTTFTVTHGDPGAVPTDLQFRGDGGVEVSSTSHPGAALAVPAVSRSHDAVCATDPTGRHMCVPCSEQALAAATPDRRHLAVACGAELIHWDLVRGAPTRALTLADPPLHLVVDDAGRAVAIGRLWMVRSNPDGAAVQWYHTGTRDRVALSARGSLLAVADRTALELWDIDAGTRALRLPLPAPALAVAVDPTATRIAVAGLGWHRVHGRDGALLEHVGTATRALVQVEVGERTLVGVDGSGGLVRVDLRDETVREPAVVHERGFAAAPSRVTVLAADHTRVLVRDGRYLRLLATSDMRELLRVRSTVGDTARLHGDDLTLHVASDEPLGPVSPATWDLRDGLLHRRPLFLERRDAPLRPQDPSGWSAVTEARGLRVEARGDGTVYRYQTGVAPATALPGATPAPAGPSLTVIGTVDSIGRVALVAAVAGAPADAVVCIAARPGSRARTCSPQHSVETLSTWTAERLTFELVHDEQRLATATWTLPALAPRAAPVVQAALPTPTTPTVDTRRGCRTQLARAPVRLGEAAELALPDGLELLDRGGGLWTGMERTLTTCDAEVSQAVVAALTAPGALSDLLERTLPRSAHPGRTVRVVTATRDLYEAEVVLPWDLPRRSSRLWLSARRVGPVAWLVLFQTTAQHWHAARDAFAAASASLRVHAAPPSLARAIPLRRVEWTSIGWLAGLDALLHTPPGRDREDMAEIRIGVDEALYRARFGGDPAIRALVSRAELGRWLDRLDAAPHIPLEPRLTNEQLGAALGLHPELGVPPFAVHAVDAADLAALADAVWMRLRVPPPR